MISWLKMDQRMKRHPEVNILNIENYIPFTILTRTDAEGRRFVS